MVEDLMQPLKDFASPGIRLVFTDIDDTLTKSGQLHAEAYEALWRLKKNGIKVVPVTGRPAGWCELIARQWPVDGVIGENGGFYFRYENKTMKRHFVFDESTRQKNQEGLAKIREEVLSTVPGSAIASDQFCRLMDLAVDFCEDVEPLDSASVSKIVEVFKKHGATAKVSSIHVNGWFGEYDKLSMCKLFCENELGFELGNKQSEVAFIGDSPNDEPMFKYFENSFAVANINEFKEQLSHQPNFVTSKPFGDGFKEFTDHILN